MIKNKVVAQAIEYILYHLRDNITIEDVAAHCYLSVSRLSTIFKEETGESVYAFIKRLKLEQSALCIKAGSGKSLTDIGETYGYSASNYSSAFSQYYKKSPSVFRNEWRNEWKVSAKDKEKILEEIDQKVRIENKPEYTIVYERYIGNYRDLKKDWNAFCEKYQEYVDEDTIFMERDFDDPTITDEDHCIYEIGMTVRHPENFENTCVLEGGKYVVYPFAGYLDEIKCLHQNLMGVWFPLRGYELDTRYSYDRYYLVREDDYMEFDICIPIK